jgi:phage gpG-like protein
VTVGTPTFYGVFHQDGAPRANIVPRPFMYLEDSDYDRIESLGLNYLARFVR